MSGSSLITFVRKHESKSIQSCTEFCETDFTVSLTSYSGLYILIIFVNDSEVRPKYCAKQTLHCSWFMMFEDSHMTHIWTKYSFKLCRLSWPVSMYEIFPGCWVMVHGIHVHSLLLVQDIQQKLNFDYRLTIKEITQLLDRSL